VRVSRQARNEFDIGQPQVREILGDFRRAFKSKCALQHQGFRSALQDCEVEGTIY
jgi:hypothetical protein